MQARTIIENLRVIVLWIVKIYQKYHRNMSANMSSHHRSSTDASHSGYVGFSVTVIQHKESNKLDISKRMQKA